MTGASGQEDSRKRPADLKKQRLTSCCCRGITSRKRFAHSRPSFSTWLRCTTVHNASIFCPLTRMFILTRSDTSYGASS